MLADTQHQTRPSSLWRRGRRWSWLHPEVENRCGRQAWISGSITEHLLCWMSRKCPRFREANHAMFLVTCLIENYKGRIYSSCCVRPESKRTHGLRALQELTQDAVWFVFKSYATANWCQMKTNWLVFGKFITSRNNLHGKMSIIRFKVSLNFKSKTDWDLFQVSSQQRLFASSKAAFMICGEQHLTKYIF